MTRGSVSRTGAAPLTRSDWNSIKALGIRRLTNDSRAVHPGDTFVAYPGLARDGRDFIGDAFAGGAASVLWERAGFAWNRKWRQPNLGLKDLRRHAGEIASEVCGRPSERLTVIGVTGTNGKTTCSQWIAQALTRAGRPCAVIGTLGSGMRPPLEPLVNTTPDSLWLHARLAEFARRGAQAVAMEVSSIGLDQDRVAGVEFDTALFTNLTRDHLDYHRTMKRYQDAKARLLTWDTLKHAVVNLDDDFGAELARRIRRPGLSVVGYGFGAARGTKVAGGNLATTARGVAFDVKTPWGSAHLACPVLGRHNAYNLLGTLAVLLANGMPLRKAVRAVTALKPVPGRLQPLGGGAKPMVVVDYAHTPDALQQVLTTLREVLDSRSAIHESRLICVFGCGGDRDRGKRPVMGRLAERLADRVVVTSDNPRGENPRRIIADIVSGTQGTTDEIVVEPSRRAAIRRAVAGARRGDIVLVAGKGHESYQEVRGVRRPFSDVAVAKEALSGR
ncbi:MAG TPA: UDP-N-acetylmuramoyl-L-alanyl-D-glutamate--2,6-diaminopimelate ligase [Burkholderiales bacterium]|nr:UDP-N-acetylmuramoyl-L-alanyl-D-glutamate--2,6-diaminopimelate ligase [Burkholderiales bacterium]